MRPLWTETGGTDATATLQALLGTGHLAEAHAWRDRPRAVAGNPADLRIMPADHACGSGTPSTAPAGSRSGRRARRHRRPRRGRGPLHPADVAAGRQGGDAPQALSRVGLVDTARHLSGTRPAAAAASVGGGDPAAPAQRAHEASTGSSTARTGSGPAGERAAARADQGHGRRSGGDRAGSPHLRATHRHRGVTPPRRSRVPATRRRRPARP
ncbi:hypothetical protein E4P41_15440 [Geodermatophilus sp. DF01-2]|nr:hypothetical protein E4P41_15440 [Geodermatophilus sp. DF01_2]